MSAMNPMNEQRAREILKGDIQPDGSLSNGGWYLAWTPTRDHAVLDGQFNADDLEAIAWWMRYVAGAQS